MPTEGFENCGNATLVAARAVPSRVPAGAVSASVPSLNLSSATSLELQFDAFGKCALRFAQSSASMHAQYLLVGTVCLPWTGFACRR